MIRPYPEVSNIMPQFDKLLVLDLDETLIYSTETRLDRAPDFAVGKYFTYKRPHLDDFLEDCLTFFKVGVWTSASEDYATGVINNIFKDKSKLEFVWTCIRCTQKYYRESDSYDLIKDFKKLKKQGYPIEKIIMVDDSREKVQRNYGNAVIIKGYTGEREDDELPVLLEYLKSIGLVENVRTINKEKWRRSTEKAPQSI